MIGFGLNRAHWFVLLDKSHAKAKKQPFTTTDEGLSTSSRGDKTAITPTPSEPPANYGRRLVYQGIGFLAT